MSSINPKTGRPAIHGFTETLDGDMVVVTYSEKRISEYDYRPIFGTSITRGGRPTYYVNVCGRNFPLPKGTKVSHVMDEAWLMLTEDFMIWARGGFR